MVMGRFIGVFLEVLVAQVVKREVVMKILSCDGGGVFGILSARCLAEMDPWNEFDAFGGTSIGAAIVASYAVGMKPMEIVESMTRDLPVIFSRPWYWAVKPWGSKWPGVELEKWCRNNFDITMGDIKKPVFIVAMNFSERKPKVYSSTSWRDRNISLADAVLSSVSAPTYFPPHGKYVDGGLFANNPSVVTAAGLSGALDTPITKMSMFSIGTGSYSNEDIDMSGAASWNVLKWGTRIIPVMLEGGNEVGMTYIASKLPFRVYFRYNPWQLKKGWAMDQAGLIPELTDLAENSLLSFKRRYNKFMRLDSLVP